MLHSYVVPIEFFLCAHVVYPYSSIDIVTASKKSRFILSERLDFHMIDNLFVRCMLTSLSVDEILLQTYVRWSTNFRGLPLKEEIAPSCLKHELCSTCVCVEANVF